MDTHSVFMAAFWAGMAAPGALLAPAPIAAYRPLISDLTVADSFFFVGALLDKMLREQSDREEPSSDLTAGQQLSFNFSNV